jgi:Uncharacterized conserved protein
MSSKIKNVTLVVKNMTCAHCETAIEQALFNKKGIVSVNAKYSSGEVKLTYDEVQISLAEIEKGIEEAGYQLSHENQNPKSNNQSRNQSGSKIAAKPNKDYTDIIGVVVIIFALFIIARRFGLLNILYQFPVAKESMGYGMLFLIGLLTSVHCVAMCGGICLSQCVPQKASNKPISKWAALRPSMLYNLGRVASYTIIGGLVGALGSVISFSGTMKGIVQILAGVFMVIMGINMLGVFPSLRKLNPRMPKIFARKIYEQKNSKSPLYIGLLNGLMPCGPLQAMQIYALSTGSPIKGALSMFLFSVGTVPLLFAFGAISSFLSKKFTSKMMTVSAVLVIVLGLFMFNYGTSLSGITLPGTLSSTSATKTASAAKIEDGVQIVTTGLSSGRYEPIIVQKGVPVKWVIQAKNGDINGCNNTIIIPKLNIQKRLEPGDNVIEFTPSESGNIGFSCWMGMIRSSITVVDDLNKIDPNSIPNLGNQQSSGGCCANMNLGNQSGFNNNANSQSNLNSQDDISSQSNTSNSPNTSNSSASDNSSNANSQLGAGGCCGGY